MTKKRKVRYDRIVLLVLIAVALIIALVLGIKMILGKPAVDDNPNNNNQIVESNDTSLELVSYDVYKDKDNLLGFNFSVIELKFKNEKGINYDFGNLVTDENIKLSDTSMYSKKFNLQELDFSLLNTVNGVITSDKEYTAKVFVPFTKDKLILTDMVSGKSFTIDVSKNEKDLSSLKYQSTESNISSSNYNLDISNSYVSDMMTRNGQDYNSSMLCIYTFDIDVKSIGDNIKLTSAVYKKNSDGESYDALDSSYASRKIDNILDKTLKVGDKYALFFEVFTDPNEKQDFSGTITFNFSDGSSKTIDTVLN
ncbi:MAG: hypothetical protein SO189_02375 [Erysipelotrichaceae bacterium]|nr:hypothetical protein [Solobacterium sp.]MDY3793776.1 hypothetical protein [Erysipelotrichaceae bacterium]